MGRDRAVLALAIVSTKAEGHFSRSAGGYFAGMVKQGRARRTAPGTQPVGAARGPLWQDAAPVSELAARNLGRRSYAVRLRYRHSRAPEFQRFRLPVAREMVRHVQAA